MNKIKLVAIDLDGTLLTDDKQLEQENIDAIEAVMAAGIKVLICTGRTLPGVKRFVKQLPQNEKEYLILHHGGVTHEYPSLEIIDEYTLSKEELIAITDWFKSVPNLSMTAYDVNNLYYVGPEEISDLVKWDANTLETAITVSDYCEVIANPHIYKVMAIETPERLDKVEPLVPEKLKETVSVMRSQPYLIEFVPKVVNKGAALNDLAKQLNISPREIMAIGDQVNDLEMIEYAGIGVAMDNAVPEVKALADRVTGNNNEAGVAQILKELL